MSLDVSVCDAFISGKLVVNVFMWVILHYLNETFRRAKTETLK